MYMYIYFNPLSAKYIVLLSLKITTIIKGKYIYIPTYTSEKSKSESINQ